jgi:TrkA domain protein
MSTIREADLPGIGRKFQIEAQSGDKLVVVIHDDGRRELYHFDPKDPDGLLSMVTLNDTEARQVAGIIGGLNYTPKALDSLSITLEGLVIEWDKIGLGSDVMGQTIGQFQVHQTTGATIMAIIEKDGRMHINPGPDQTLTEDVTLVIVGERQQVAGIQTAHRPGEPIANGAHRL